MATKARIFVVEDHESTARAIKMFLETQGYEVTHAPDIASALEAAGKDGSFDLLLCDISLPDGNGWDLMQKLSARGPVRAIAFTASGSPDDIARSKEAGFLLHFVKGSPADDLVVAIEQALNRKPAARNTKTTSPGRDV
jgi:CheY-like chemotaxis protein